jgi:hypothetical protein
MRTRRVKFIRGRRFLATLLALSFLPPTFAPSAFGQDKPTGKPLELSSVETEQPVPLAYLTPDGKTAKCAPVRIHWISKPFFGPDEDAATFTIDLPADNPAAPLFTAQLWNASLASAMAWQVPWEGARWKILDTPVTDGSGIDAALAVGMIATSARRPYPATTVVIGHLNPDGSLGPVSRLVDRIDAAASAGMKRVIIPSVQRFDTDASGQVLNMVRHASQEHLECIPVDDLFTATETTMNDPLPEKVALDAAIPKYNDDISAYIDDFANREQNEATEGLKFAPKETELAAYPPRLAAVWKSVYADYQAGVEAHRAGQVYVAFRLFMRVNGRMAGANAVAGQTLASFDVKTALADSDDLHDHLHILMTPPPTDKGDLASAVLTSEMADWAYDINAALEGSQLVAKQAFSQRSDATEAEKDRAREAILFANVQCKYLLTQSDFYSGLLDHMSHGSALAVQANATHLLPQLIPAQLAIARRFTDGIRLTDLRNGLLFDPELVAYVNVLRQAKADWDAHQRRKDAEAVAAATAPAPATTGTTGAEPIKLNSNADSTTIGFDPGDTYRPPHTIVEASDESKKLSDAALCLIWVNNECEIATLDEKYLRLNGTMDPATHEWHVKDRPRLDALLQMAELGARQGIAFASKAEIDSSVLSMIYEKASHDRTEGSDTAALDALRNYWRCALLGNMCWQLSHAPKAQPVDLAGPPMPPKPAKTTDAKTDQKTTSNQEPVANANPAATTNTVVAVNPNDATTTTHDVVTPAPNPPNPPQPAANVDNIPVAPIAHEETSPVVMPPTTNAPAENSSTPPVAVAVPANTNSVVEAVAPAASTNTDIVTPTAVPAPAPPTPPAPAPVPIAATPPAQVEAPQAPAPAVMTNVAPTPTSPAPAAPTATASDDANIPVAPIAKASDLTPTDTAPVPTTAADTNSTAAVPPAPAPVPPAPAPHQSSKANADAAGGGAF